MSKFETTEQKVSYGIGMQMGMQLLQGGFPGLEIDLVKAGLKDTFTGSESQVSNEELQEAFQQINLKLEEIEREKAKAGEEFLVENGKKDGVITTASGLQYEIIAEGKGELASLTSTVKTHYHGTFIDGRVFDSSVERGEPAQFPVNGVIAGWTEALQVMPVGSKWRLYIPSHLAYGENGAGSSIPPYSTLIFDIELLEII